MKLFKYIMAVLMLNIYCTGMAHSPLQSADQEKVTPLLVQSLPDIPHHKAYMLVVDFLPDQAAKPHKHPGSVFAYVLEGSITSQLEGQKPITYHQGEYWYEPPNVGHVVCKNASSNQHAKLLVWQLVQDDLPTLLPYEQKKKQ